MKIFKFLEYSDQLIKGDTQTEGLIPWYAIRYTRCKPIGKYISRQRHDLSR